jgi:HEAT repeats
MSAADMRKPCDAIGPLLFFFVCDEVNEQERAAIEKHVAVCADCREHLETERALHSDLASLPQASDQLDPSGVLLSQCRSNLSEKLDDLHAPAAKEKWLSFFWLRRWLTVHPAWSAALLILFGLVTGVQGTQWLTGLNNANALDQAVNVRPEMKFTNEQLSKMAVTGVNFISNPDAGPQHVRVQMSAEQPVELIGSLDNQDVRRVLTFVVGNGKQFDPGLRLDCLDALKTLSGDVEVRGALLAAARKDENPAVRLKALEALRDASSDHTVRLTLLDALHHDSNPGVRVEAVNLLVRSLEAENARGQNDAVHNGKGMTVTLLQGEEEDLDSLNGVLRTLEVLQRTDPNPYVRLRSAAALREIGDRDEQ